jgi:hypothetical protein
MSDGASTGALSIEVTARLGEYLNGDFSLFDV